MIDAITSFITGDGNEKTKANKKKGKVVMGRARIANSTKFLNAMLRGASVSWTDAQNKFNLARPRAVVDKLREEGYCVYINKSSKGTSYRIGTPSKAIVAAGLMALEGQAYA
tara:strand:- start:204 stop:539 length:336 start_codon:yes stop_codon:yes gene_type:complete